MTKEVEVYSLRLCRRGFIRNDDPELLSTAQKLVCVHSCHERGTINPDTPSEILSPLGFEKRYGRSFSSMLEDYAQNEPTIVVDASQRREISVYHFRVDKGFNLLKCGTEEYMSKGSRSLFCHSSLEDSCFSADQAVCQIRSPKYFEEFFGKSFASMIEYGDLLDPIPVPGQEPVVPLRVVADLAPRRSGCVVC